MFNIDIEGIRLTGYIDRIDRIDKLDSGGLSIVDYKTDIRPFTTDDLENSLQLTLYQLSSRANLVPPCRETHPVSPKVKHSL